MVKCQLFNSSLKFKRQNYQKQSYSITVLLVSRYKIWKDVHCSIKHKIQGGNKRVEFCMQLKLSA